MSYQVLARKYRPRSFETLVGQEHVVRALTHALEQKRLHHAWLFTGTRGVGKTTLSRILAKSLNCQGADGNGDVTAQPCGVCDACTAIDAGRFVDYIEMDAASNRGVDEMAQLLEQAVYAPSNARYKIYMIDEVHMLSSHAFNAMLKTLEEPPEHVKFILATTDPQKIPVTVLSRCLQFNLKQMPPGHIVSHLDNILSQEAIQFETPALRLLAHGAQGSMRDALSLADQAIAYSAGNITLDAVQGMLGALDQSYLLRLLDALAAADGTTLLAVADEMAGRSLSYNTALQDLGSLLHRIALAQTVPAALPEDLPEREDILRLASQMQADEVQLYYQIVVHGRNELGLAPDEYAGFTMTLLRLLAFRPAEADGQGAPPAPAPSRTAATPRPAAGAAASPASLGGRSAPASASPAAGLATAASAAVAPAPAATARPTGGPARAALEAARGAVRANAAPRSAMPSAVPSVLARPSAPATSSRPHAPPTPVRPAPAMETAVESAYRAAAPWEDAGFPDAAAQPVDVRNAGMTDIDLRHDMRHNDMPDIDMPDVEQQQRATSVPPMPGRADPAARTAEPLPIITISGWSGDWPSLASALPLRGVVQQLALQSELVRCDEAGGGISMQLRVPVETLCSAGSPEKLAAALSAQLGKQVQLGFETGPVTLTASAAANAEREQRQRDAEQKIQNDPFVQTLMREFGATVVPGSVRPN